MANLQKIRILQENRRIEFKELAQNIGFTTQGIRNAIKNEKIMSDVLERIAAYFGVPVGYFFDECEATGVVGGHHIIQTAQGHTISQTIGEKECNRKLELAEQKIRGLEEQLKLKDEIIELLRGKK